MDDFDELANNKLFLAVRSFRDPADDDYLTARWSYLRRLEYPFYWHAQQCVEKYLKCALLLNGETIKSYNDHKTEPMLEKSFEVFGALLPKRIAPPPGFPNIDDPLLGFGGTIELIERISQNGDPNNRYGLFSTDWNRVGIHAFDELCFTLRRLCGILDAKKGDGRPLRDILSSEPRYQVAMASFLNRFGSASFEDIRRMNFSFFPDESLNEAKFLRTLIPGFVNSPLSILLQSGSDDADDAIEWFVNRVFMPKKAKLKLEDHLRKSGRKR